jgi:serine/threonine protein kinase
MTEQDKPEDKTAIAPDSMVGGARPNAKAESLEARREQEKIRADVTMLVPDADKTVAAADTDKRPAPPAPGAAGSYVRSTDIEPTIDISGGSAPSASAPLSRTAGTAVEGAPLKSVTIKVGAVLKDRFLLKKQLGEGGMGAVYLAVDQRKVETRHHDPHVAIKLIRGQFARDSRAFVALQRETDKSQTLAHPNIITVYDFDRDGDVFFMTMEALKGNTLDVFIKSPERSREKAMQYIVDIANGIAYAHKRDIVHSDLKPQNIFVTDDGRLKVLDLGIARALSKVEGAQNVPGDEVVGLTPSYASCEMFEKAEPHPADDVYAMGLIAYQLLTGEHPYGRKKSIFAREKGMKPKRIKGITAYQWRAINKALAFDRADRWQNADEFLRHFTGAGRRVKQLAAGLLVAVISFGVYVSFFEPEAGPEVPFEELPVATQTELLGYLKEADLALKFNDLNGSLFYLDKAYHLHPRNADVMARLDAFLDQVAVSMEQSDESQADKLAQVRELLKYESLSLNPRLLGMEKALQQ